MMEIDEAIKHAEQVAELNEAECFECAEEHRQLAKWLKELKALREQKRPRGEWIEDLASFGYVDLECSVCGCLCECVECGKQYNFCPNCGADMREGDEK